MALTKLIDSASFFRDEPQVTVIDFSTSKGLLKQAADSRVNNFVSQISPEADKVYVHILAMGAGEFYGANRNADYFPEHNLLDCYKTFETTPAHIFRNHINKNPAIAIGKVIFAIYNERMHRVEVIAYIEKSKGQDVIDRIENGDFPATSMACKTPYDVCSICGNKAHTRQEYCDHLRTQLGKMYPDGRKVMALNVAPLKFFDMSIVVRPADVTSSVLQKVAAEDDHTISSIDEAESQGLEEGMPKQAALKKLSEFIKEIDGNMVEQSAALDAMLAKVRDPDYSIIPILKNFKLPEVFATMAELGISPSITFLAELIARKMIGDHIEGIGSLVASFVHNMGAHHMEIPDEETKIHDPVFAIANTLKPYIPGSSFLPEFVEKRASFYDNTTNTGFIGNGPIITPTPYEKFRERNLKTGNDTSSLMKIMHMITAIGGAALAAKWYITRTIEQKMKELPNTDSNSGVKIILVKSASDYRLTYRLAKAAMVKALKA